MAETGSDVIMFFQDKDGIFLDAECASVLDTTNDGDFLEGFTAGKYCEITDFDVGIKKDGSDAGAGKVNNTGPFGSWLAIKKADNDASGFPIHFDELSFTRTFDCSSPIIFRKCCMKETFKRIVVIRRRSVGSALGPKAYLRLEFKEVLLTKVNWTGSETLKENCSFICREFTGTYRITDDQGLTTPFSPALWKFKIDLSNSADRD